LSNISVVLFCRSHNAVTDGWIDSLWKEVLLLHPLIPPLSIIPHTTL